jgi:hypothetical protein
MQYDVVKRLRRRGLNVGLFYKLVTKDQEKKASFVCLSPMLEVEPVAAHQMEQNWPGGMREKRLVARVFADVISEVFHDFGACIYN